MREPFGPALFTFCHPEATGSMTCGNHLVSYFLLFSSRGGGPDDMREPFGPALFTFVIQRRRPDDMREPFGPALFTFVIQRWRAR